MMDENICIADGPTIWSHVQDNSVERRLRSGVQEPQHVIGKEIKHSILEKQDYYDNELLNPLESIENRGSMEKSDGTIH